MDTGDVLLQRAAAEADPTDVLLWEATDELDPVDTLLWEAEQLGAGVFDDDIKELLVDAQPRPTTECQLVVTAATAPAPSSSTSPSAANTLVSRCHLILGNSIAKHIQLPASPGDSVLNLAEGGNTWQREERNVQDHLREWETERSKNGTTPGTIFICMGGNDATDGQSNTPRVWIGGL